MPAIDDLFRSLRSANRKALMPFVTAVWQIYLLIFLLNLFSAGFKPVFAATIPDVLPDEAQYTKALSYSRLAYDLENLLSPTIAGIALLVFSYTGLFAANSIAFVISAVLIVTCALPQAQPQERQGGVWSEISFGVIAYMKTPRLRRGNRGVKRHRWQSQRAILAGRNER